MEERAAVNYLQRNCLPPNIAGQQARSQWLVARGKIGAANPRAGRPEILDITGHEVYLDQVRASPRYADTVGTMTASFKQIEIGPVLAFQFEIEIDRASGVCTGLSKPPTLAEMMPICLPTTSIDPRPITAFHDGDDSITVTSENKNIRVLFRGPREQSGGLLYDPNQSVLIAGIGVGEGSPLVQIIRFQDRCYFRNGYHRAYTLAREGMTHIPCVFLEATDFSQVIDPKQQGGTFSRGLLQSANPPTFAHFLDRAYRVSLRQRQRTIRLHWEEEIR